MYRNTDRQRDKNSRKRKLNYTRKRGNILHSENSLDIMNYISTETERQMNKWTETQRDRKVKKAQRKYYRNT